MDDSNDNDDTKKYILPTLTKRRNRNGYNIELELDRKINDHLSELLWNKSSSSSSKKRKKSKKHKKKNIMIGKLLSGFFWNFILNLIMKNMPFRCLIEILLKKKEAERREVIEI